MRRHALLMIASSIVAASAAEAEYGNVISRSYNPLLADQFPYPRSHDIVPADPALRQAWARHLAYDAAIYGTAAVLQYRQMYDQAINRSNPAFVGFNRFAHDRSLAGPGYKPFKSPNADTLYSNAYLDLRNGPLLLDVPDTAGRYYTVNFLDMFGNGTNISARTHGTKGGRFLIATTDWKGQVPPGATLFRVASPYMWILMRILVSDPRDVGIANALQDRFVLGETMPHRPPTHAYPNGTDTSAIGFLRILDFVLRNNGHPQREDALVYRFQRIGISGPEPFDKVIADSAIRAGVDAGVAEAQKLIQASMTQIGRQIGSWRHSDDSARFGYNYLFRSAITTLGAGGNVDEENYAFTTFLDGSGARLDGSKAGYYELTLDPPPPARFFWSVTVYDARTRELHPNPLQRYLINDRTPGLVRGRDGSVTIRLQATRPQGSTGNWLPIPPGPFYVAIRSQGPKPEIIEGRWAPPPIRPLEVSAR
jgi:hypothetical protein